MSTNVTLKLIDLNLGWLDQALTLLDRIDDATYAGSPGGLRPHRAGGHLRHILEFYESFLDGLPQGRVDYDNRRRDESIERSRAAAASKIRSIAARLDSLLPLHCDAHILVRMENDQTNVWFDSSLGRELQALSSHTIHHFALMSVTLRMHGVEVDPDFGMSPSTLRYHAEKARRRVA